MMNKESDEASKTREKEKKENRENRRTIGVNDYKIQALSL